MADTQTMEYLGPSDVLVVGDKTYRRPVGGSVKVQISEGAARAMAASATHHRFVVGGKELRIATPAEQRGRVEASDVVPTASEAGSFASDAGTPPLVEAKQPK